MKEVAPAFSLKAVMTERVIGIPDSLPQVLVLLFQDQNTVDSARSVNRAIRQVYKEPDDLLVASIVNLAAVPRMMRGFADKLLRRAYNGAAAEIPAGYDPADYIILLPDWQGTVFRRYSVPDVGKQALMVIVDHEGHIVLRRQEGDLGRLALQALEKLI